MAGPTQLFTNNAISLLAAPIAAGDTMLTVMAGHGSLFPQPANDGSDFFLVTLEDQFATLREIIRVGSRYGDTFVDIERAQEGTPALPWGATPGNDTLVDHRITAETMRQAMLLPTPIAPPVTPSGITGITVQQNGVTVGALATTINFTGASTVTGAGATKTVNVTGGSGGTSVINGENTLTPVTILPAQTEAISVATYSQYQRSFKFLITLFMPSFHYSTTFEILANVNGFLAADAETVTFNQTSRLGRKFAGTADITLDVTTKQLRLTWTNLEVQPIEVMCTRIQHLA
jgi:hypothetical protein